MARSTATNKNSLYDSYMRSLRWASDRIDDEGVIAFVSNSSFIDGNTADGVRLTWQDEFSHIYVYNLKGNQRTQGERSKQEGGKIFGSGSRTGVAITILVKKKERLGDARVFYTEVADYLSRQEKLDVLVAEGSITRTSFDRISPNSHGDWLNQRDEAYLEYQELGDGKTKGKSDTPGMFHLFSRGLATSRDSWCYSSNPELLSVAIDRHIEFFNEQMHRVTQLLGSNAPQAQVREVLQHDSTRGSIDRRNATDIARGNKTVRSGQILRSIYRPFFEQFVYFDKSRRLNNDTYQLPRILPSPAQPNVGFCVDSDATKVGAALMTDSLPDLHTVGTNQYFPLYTWEPIEDDESMFSLSDDMDWADAPSEFSGVFDFSKPISQQVPVEVAGYRRKDNITDATLAAYRKHYADARNSASEQINREDIFFYVYALLHHPQYREKYEADLKKMLPRIPKVKDFWVYANVGRELADLHVNYERLELTPWWWTR